MINFLFVEHFTKLHSLSVIIKANFNQHILDTNDFKLEITHDKLWLNLNGSDRVLILDCISQTLPQLQLSNLSTEFKISKANDAYSDLITLNFKISHLVPLKTSGDSIEKPLGSSLIKQVLDLSCKQCTMSIFKNTISDYDGSSSSSSSSNIRDTRNNVETWRVCDLPSSYWHEFLDCWVCHPDTQQMKAANGYVNLKCPSSTLLCGTSFILLPLPSLPTTTLSITPGDGSIECGNCGHVIGTLTSISSDTAKQRNPSEIKLFKYELVFKILSTTTTRDEEPVKSCTFTQCLLYDLFENCRAHACFKYLLTNDNDKNTVYCKIWIFNWDTRVIISKSQRNVLKDAVKVMYIEDGNDNGNDEFEKYFCTSNQAEEVLKQLRSNHELLPCELSRMGDFRVSILFK